MERLPRPQQAQNNGQRAACNHFFKLLETFHKDGVPTLSWEASVPYIAAGSPHLRKDGWLAPRILSKSNAGGDGIRLNQATGLPPVLISAFSRKLISCSMLIPSQGRRAHSVLLRAIYRGTPHWRAFHLSSTSGPIYLPIRTEDLHAPRKTSLLPGRGLFAANSPFWK